MTKKFLGLLSIVALMGTLSACNMGKKTVSSCDSLMEYTECSLKKSNMDSEMVKSTLEKTKAAWENLGEESESYCKQAVDTIKKSGAVVDGCDLNSSEVDEKEVDEKEVDEKEVDEKEVDEKEVDEKEVDEESETPEVNTGSEKEVDEESETPEVNTGSEKEVDEVAE